MSDALFAKTLDDDFFTVSQIDLIRNLLRAGCSIREMCKIIGVSRATFYRRKANNDALRETVDKAKAEGKAALLITAHKQAFAGDAAQTRWLLDRLHMRGDFNRDDESVDEDRTLDELQREVDRLRNRSNKTAGTMMNPTTPNNSKK